MESINILGARIKLTDMTEPDVIQFYGWFWSSPPERMTCWPVEPMTLAETVERFRAAPAPNSPRRIAIRRIEDDTFVGRISYFNVNSRSRSVEIGYLMGPDFRGKGYASDAVALLMNYLFSELNMNRVYAQTGAFNAPSVALLEKCGFKLEARLRQHHEVDGTFHDDLIFGVLADEFFLDVPRGHQPISRQ